MTEVKKQAKKTKTPKRQGATAGGDKYARITAENKQWVAKQCYETGQSSTVVVNTAIESIRTGKPFKLEMYEPQYLKRALANRDNRLKRLRDQAGQNISA